MTLAANGSDLIFSYKLQSGLGSSASGSGATSVLVRPSPGIQRQTATIQSQLIDPSLMRDRARQGSITATGAWETEAQVGMLDGIVAGVLGNTATASFTLTEASASLASVTISGTGVTITNGGGSWITSGVRRGMMGKFANLATSANDGVWFPILNVTAGVITAAPGFLVDETIDSGFTLVLAKSIATGATYAPDYYTIEEYLGAGVDFSKLLSDARWTNFGMTCAPNAMTTVSFGATGLALTAPTGASAPNFTSPTGNAQSAPSSLVLLDGGLYRDGVKFAALTAFNWALQSQATVTPLLSSRTGIDVGLSMFDGSGSISSVVTDSTEFAASLAESNFSLFMHLCENESDPKDFISVYIGNASYGSWSAPIVEQDTIQTMPLYIGKDRRGGASLPSTIVWSTSAA